MPWLVDPPTMWVRSEYAGELAVLVTWLSAVIPWNVTYVSNVASGALLFVRFPLLQIRYSFGVPVARGVVVADPLSATALQRGQPIELAYQVWSLGAAVFLSALVVSAVYYRREAWVESWPLDPVRLLGGLLVLTGTAFAGATWLLLTRGFPGVPLPVGVGFLFLFGAVLLVADRSPGAATEA
jgi:hypothetical protein